MLERTRKETPVIKTSTTFAGATGAFAMPSHAEYALGRKRNGAAGIVGAVALRPVNGSDAALWASADVPTPVPVRLGGAFG